MTEEQETVAQKRRIVILSGMSGAGISTALRAFEDLGYEAVDNLRLSLIPALVDDADISERNLAIAVDVRNSNFTVEGVLHVSSSLSVRTDMQAELLFLDSSDEKLQQRYTETRRRHPLAIDRPVTDGILAERELLRALKEKADRVIDTSDISVHDLRRIIGGNYRFDCALGLTIFVTSFSYRHGVPRESDLVFDARFLINPHWEPALRMLSGQDKDVAEYIKRDQDYHSFIQNLVGLILPLLPRYQREGKSYLTIAVGCTGGRHRSVTVAEDLADMLAVHGYIVGIGHRDLERGGNRE